MAITATVQRGFTFNTGVDVTASALNQLGEPTVTINEGNVNITGGTISGLSSPIAIADGGTGSANAGAARTALGLGTIATQASNAVALTGGTISGTIMTLKSYAVSGVPSASPAGQMIYVTDGNSGAATVAVSDGSAWKVVALGATIST
ncbi:hypothetical protein [uncultured Mediterranean phage uvMED]|nr:hypothetical protein [uncultured Mediterranean phage uvMED]